MSKDNGVSQSALSVARIMDRLDPGEYIILLVKPGRGKEHYIELDISKKEQVDRRIIGIGPGTPRRARIPQQKKKGHCHRMNFKKCLCIKNRPWQLTYWLKPGYYK